MKMQWWVALGLMALAASAAAQEVYTWTAEDGSTVFSDQPPPSGVTGQSFTPSTPTVVEQDRVQRSRLLRQSREISRRTDEKIRRRDEVRKELQEARKALADAQQALEAGREPQAGERKRIVGGGTRLGEAYFQRLEGLERRIADAQARVDELNVQLQRLGR